MKKVIVIGCPGSGKSTVSLALHNKTGIPLYHLDKNIIILESREQADVFLNGENL